MSQKRKSKRWLKVTGIILLVLVIAGGAYGYTVYNSLKNAVETMHQPIDREKSDKRDKPVALPFQS